jgi:hypothetical protein
VTGHRGERRYARWMLAYPPAWRRVHGEALLAVLLDAAQARGGRGPTVDEVVDLLRHGLGWRLRLAAPARARRAVAWAALVVGTAVALTGLLSGSVAAAVPVAGLPDGVPAVAPWQVPGLPVHLLWLAAAGAVLLGRARAARRLLLAVPLLLPLQLLVLLTVTAAQDVSALRLGSWIELLWLVPASLLAAVAPVRSTGGPGPGQQARRGAAVGALLLAGISLLTELLHPSTGTPTELWAFDAWVLPATRLLLTPLPWPVLAGALALLVGRRWRHGPLTSQG